MGWVIALLVVAIAITAVPGLRKVGAVILIAVAGIGFWLYDGVQENRKKLDERIAVARTLIQPSQIAFSNVTLGSNYGSHRLQGTVQNNADVELLAVVMHVVIQNCPTETGCVTVGEQETVIDSRVPPKQARGFEKLLYFRNLPTMTQMRWHYRVGDVLGNPDKK